MFYKRKKGAITLVDALVALIILSLGFLMILTIAPGTAVFIKRSENRLLAKQIAQTYVEYYSSSQQWATVTATGFYPVGTEIIQASINGKMSSTSFTWSASSSLYAASTAGSLYNLMVTVTWKEQYMGKAAGAGDIKQIELATMVSKPD